MDYFKKITLQHNAVIVDRYKHYGSKATELHAMAVPNTEWKWLKDHIIDDISSITGKNHFIKSVIIFFQKGHHVRGIHVDGYRTNTTDFSWALNIPIENCQQAKMVWYSGEYSMKAKSNKIGLPSLHLNWQSTPCVVASTSLDSPVIVKVDVPHTVINSSSTPRCLLSIRFSPELF
jgi:hypothetical protein